MRLLSALLLLSLASAAGAQQDVVVDAGRGPIKLHVPAAYEQGEPIALVVQLHGYGSSAVFNELYMRMTAQSDARGFLLALPNGTLDVFGARYWNATNACCEYFGELDDSAYLRNLVEVVAATYSVDARRVYFVGHSNGGFMSHRMACDHADLVTAIVSVAGANWEDIGECQPSEPVHTLQIHGTADDVIFYPGGCLAGLGCYPGARTTTEGWAALNGCEVNGVITPPLLDLIGGPAKDTLRRVYDQNCVGGSAQLWTAPGASHVPALADNFALEVADYLLSKAKP